MIKAVILAGGLGTRLSEETDLRPKPMVEIGGKPIIWHIMKTYSHHGINDFIICLGYKGYVFKEYFSNYILHMNDVTIDMSQNRTVFHEANSEPWKITLIDTGQETMTGGRLKRVADYLPNDEPFCLTYGDGLSNVDIQETIRFHKSQGKAATMTVVRQPGRYGVVSLEAGMVKSFIEKPHDGEGWINGGYFVMCKSAIDYIQGDSTVLEETPLNQMAAETQLSAYQHDGFWQCMDTLRDKHLLERLWSAKQAPWKIWK